MVSCLCVEEQDSRSAIDEPTSVEDANSTVSHGLDRSSKLGVRGLQLFHLNCGLFFGKQTVDGAARSLKLTELWFKGPMRV